MREKHKELTSKDKDRQPKKSEGNKGDRKKRRGEINTSWLNPFTIRQQVEELRS